MDNVDRSLEDRRRERSRGSDEDLFPPMWSAFLSLKEETPSLRYQLVLESPDIEELIVDISIDDDSAIKRGGVTADTTQYDGGVLILDITVKKKIENHHVIVYPKDNLITCILYTRAIDLGEEDDPPLYCEWCDGVLHF